jgi:hypothetical protein
MITENPIRELISMLSGTAELMGKNLSPEALVIMAQDLSIYPPELITQALKNVRNGKSPFSQGAIVAEIESLQPDGRLGAEEAWATYPHNERDTAVITDEMASAMNVARVLIEEGDLVAARMAFKESYTRIVKTNKANNIAPKWFASLGHAKEGREEAIKQAVALGRISQHHAQSLLPAPKNEVIESLVPHLKMLTKNDELTDEERQINKQKLAELKAKFFRSQA